MSSTDKIKLVEAEITDLKKQLKSQLSEPMAIAILGLLVVKENQLTELYKQTAPTGKKY